MAQTVVIDIEAQYRDKTKSGVKSSADDMDRLRKKMEDTEAAGKKANASLEKIATTVAQLSKKTITIPVKILDYATKPLRSMLNFATSLKGILAGLVVGQAGQMVIGNPLGLADQYSNAYIGFKTLFNSAERAQQMMDDLDEFARTTPYKTSNVIGQTQKMLAMGWDANRLIQDMTIIGDAAAATGKGDEGLERIVLALAQIKSKGKLSTEELNQLAEAGINAKAYVAAGLGYGTGDAAQQQLAKALEGGKIGGNAAVEMILAGMQENYSGMMESIAQETVSGIKSNIEDTFEINIFRKWGQGLQEGAKRGLGAMADMLDANQDRLSAMGDKLQDIAATLSNDVADAAEDAIGKAMDIMESEAFEKATIPGKAKMLWDKIIAEPFDAWWDSDGQAFVGNVAQKIGTGLGKFYGGVITTVLGINADDAAEGGINIGAKFAEGFLDGFNAEKVWEAIKSSFANALKIVPGGESATASSWISAALLGYGGMKVAGAVSPLVSGVSGLIGAAKAGTTSGAAAAAGGIGGALSMKLGALLTGGTLAGGVAGPLSAGALSALGLAGGAGMAVGGVGLVSGIADLTKAVKENSTQKERSTHGWSSAAKLGMVGTGAAAGAALGSIIPGIGNLVGAAVGAGIGGIGALAGGSKIGQGISDLLDGTAKINSTKQALSETSSALAEASDKASKFTALKDDYEALTAKIESGQMETDELAKAQSDLQDTIQALADLYPDLITQYDIENGKLEEKLGLIKQVSEAQRDQSRRDAQMAVYEGKQQLPSLESKIKDSQSEQEAALKKYDELYEQASQLEALAGMQKTLETMDEASKEYQDMQKKFMDSLQRFNSDYGTSYGGGASMEKAYENRMDSAKAQLEKAEAAGAELESLMGSYQEIYQSFIDNALNPESLDAAGGLGSILKKIEEIQAAQEERAELEKKLSGIDKGSDDYESTAKKIEEAKQRQQELTSEVEPFKEALKDVLDSVVQINNQFELLGNKRLDFAAMGLTGASSYIGYINGSMNTKNTAPRGDLASYDPLQNSKYFGAKAGFASGTLSAPPGTFWVGENGPELMQFRGGERVYNAEDSRRIAAANARSIGRSSSGGVNVNLGGMTINVSGGNGTDIVSQIKSRLPEIGNELCSMMATQITKSYANMPTTVEGI